MTLTAETRFNIGDPVYFLNFNHEITKGFVTRIDSNVVVYKDNYTGAVSQYTTIRYDVVTNTEYIDESHTEDTLYGSPDEILAMFNDQIEQGDFD